MTPEIAHYVEQTSEQVPEWAYWAVSSVPVFLAFKLWVRKSIGRRDDWTCQDYSCDDGTGKPKSFKDGWMVDAAHKPEHHSKDDPMYDLPEAGDIMCVDHHQEQHERGTTLGRRKDSWAIKQLKKRDRRTYHYRNKKNG